MSLGCYGSAVEILQRLELWEELALCYLATDRKAKAKSLVQQQLEVQATPSLLCLMGDITQVSGDGRSLTLPSVSILKCKKYFFKCDRVFRFFKHTSC